MSAPTDTDDDATMLVQFLHDRDVECPVCKYNLRMLTTPRCPECGRELRLTVGTLEPFMRAWIMLSIAIWIGAGVGLLLACLLVAGGRPDPSTSSPVCTCIAYIPLAVVGTLMRRKYMRMARNWQWFLAVLACGGTAALFIWFVRTI